MALFGVFGNSAFSGWPQIRSSMRPSGVMQKLGNPGIENRWTVFPQVCASLFTEAKAGYQNGNWQNATVNLGLEALNTILIVTGIPLFNKLFNKLIGYFPLHNDLRNNLDVGWVPRLGRKNDFEISIEKRYMKTAVGSNKADIIRTSRLLFSTVSIFLLLGILIPWLQQKQANKQKQRYHDLNTPVKAFSFYQNPVSEKEIEKYTKPQSPFPTLQRGIPFRLNIDSESRTPVDSDLNHALKKSSQSLPFGGKSYVLSKNLYNALNSVNSIITNTVGGDIVTNAAYAAGGQTFFNGKHNLLNGLQIIANSATNLYFYLLFTPQVLKRVNWLSQKASGVPITLEPRVAKIYHQEILKHVDPKRLTLSELRLLIYGDKNRDLVSALEAPLRYYLRSTNLERFRKLYHLEGLAYMGPQKWHEVVNHNLMNEFFEDHPPTPLHTDNSEISLEAIGKLRQLMLIRQSYTTWEEERAADTTIQLAYRHTAGISKPEFMDLLKEYKLEQSLTSKEFKKLVSRLDRLVQQDTWDTLNSMFRRGIVFTQNSLGATHPAILHAEALANWLERSAMERNPLPKLLSEELEEILSLLEKSGSRHSAAFSNGTKMFRQMLKAKGSFSHDIFNAFMLTLNQNFHWKERVAHNKLQKLQILFKEKATLSEGISNNIINASQRMATAIGSRSDHQHIMNLLAYYNQEMDHLLTHGGRMFSLYFDPRNKENILKIQELLEGGTIRENAILRKGLRITGHLAESYRKPLNFTLQKKQQMGSLIHNYFNDMMHYLEKGKSNRPLISRMNQFYRESRNIRYFLAIPLGYMTAMLGVIYLMPLMQKNLKWLVDLYQKENNQPTIPTH